MAIDLSPRFTVSLRGYDKEEVEHYLETVSERASQADDQLYELQEQNRYFEEEQVHLAARVEELEAAIRSETPRTVGALGERITLILNEAEQGAADTMTEARAQAEYLVTEATSKAERLVADATSKAQHLLTEAQRDAEARRRQASMTAAQATETLVVARRESEQLAERLKNDAEARAASILSEAELRAQRRQEQIEQWAQEAITSIHAEQARLNEEFAVIRERHETEVRALLGDRDEAVAALTSLQSALVVALERMPTGPSARAGIEVPAPAELSPNKVDDRSVTRGNKKGGASAIAVGPASSAPAGIEAGPGRGTADSGTSPGDADATGDDATPPSGSSRSSGASGGTFYDVEGDSQIRMTDVVDWSAES